jgi:hypothetical protein
VIKEKFLQSRDWVQTSQLFQASLKTPGEARTINQSVWETGIAEGVRKGLFGLGELENEKPIYRYFIEETTPSFAEDEILIKAEICEAQKEAQEGKSKYQPGTDTYLPRASREPGLEIPPVITPHTDGTILFPPTVTTAGRTQLSFNFVIPKGKVASLMGVLNYLQSKYNRVEIFLKLAEGQLTEQEYEDKIKEAFRQMGVDIE